jgi:hypothetical protein
MFGLCTKCQHPEPQLRGEFLYLRTFGLGTVVDGSEKKLGSLRDSEGQGPLQGDVCVADPDQF